MTSSLQHASSRRETNETQGSAGRQDKSETPRPSGETQGEPAGLFPAALLCDGFVSALEFNGPALATLTTLQRKVYNSSTALGEGWVSFLHRRLNEHLNMAERIAACRTPQDIYQVQTDYLRKGTEEYLAHVERTLSAGRGLANDLFATMAAANPR